MDLMFEREPFRVAVDGRMAGAPADQVAGRLATGVLQRLRGVVRVTTEEGYEIRVTPEHRIMTDRGWVPAAELQPGDEVHVLNRKGGFGREGSLDLGRVLGWLVGDGSVKADRAVLSFWGEERELAPVFAESVAAVVRRPQRTGVRDRGWWSPIATRRVSSQLGCARSPRNTVWWTRS